jgi:hypothetical protein
VLLTELSAADLVLLGARIEKDACYTNDQGRAGDGTGDGGTG